VQEAKAKLSEVLRKAREEGPQLIGTQHACVVVPLEAWEEKRSARASRPLASPHRTAPHRTAPHRTAWRGARPASAPGHGGAAAGRGGPVQIADGLIAGTAVEHGLTVANRDIADFEDLGATVTAPSRQDADPRRS
jgi:prevent-host-death family protein